MSHGSICHRYLPVTNVRDPYTDVLTDLNHEPGPAELCSVATNTLLYAVTLTALFDLYSLFLSIFYVFEGATD